MSSKTSNTIIDERDIKSLWKALKRNWYVFIAFLAIAFALAKIYIYQANTIYASSISILLEEDKTEDLRTSILEDLGVYTQYENISNEMRKIKSASLVKETLMKLNLKVSYFIEGKLKTDEFYTGVPFKVEGDIKNYRLYNTPFYINIINEYAFKLNIETEDYSYEGAHMFGEQIKTEDFSLVIHKKEKLEESIEQKKQIKYFFKIHTFQELLNKYKSNLSVYSEDWSAVVEVQVRDQIPGRAQDFLDTLVSVYFDQSLETQMRINSNTLKFIEEQINEVVNNLNDIESNLETYKEKELVYDLHVEQGTYFDKLIAIRDEETALERELRFLDLLDDYMDQNQSSEVLPPFLMELSRDPNIKTYLEELYNLEKLKKNALVSAQPEGFAIKNLEKKIAELRRTISTYIKNRRASNKEKLALIRKEAKNYERLMQKIPGTERELVNIQRKLGINEEIYLFLLEKKAETIIAKAGIVPDRSILEPAHSIGIVHPNQQKIQFSALGIALIASLVVVFIRRLFFETIDNKDDLEMLSDIPVFGIVGRTKKAKQHLLVVNEETRSHLTETFRGIRANFEYLAADKEHKVVLVTSCVAGEGKTFNSLNIASILAKADKKVLLLDLDFHKPRVHRAFDLDNEKGLTSYIVSKATFEETVKQTSIDNLDVIPAGPVPPNASELILSKQLEDLIREKKQAYDYVIIDTPPVGILSDALVLMKLADVNLYVLRAGKARKSFIKVAEQIREDNKPQNFGFILNGVRKATARYGYGYGYGYGYYEDAEARS